MKNFLILAIAIFSLQIVSAQEQTPIFQDNIYQMEEVDVKPEYPKGTQAFYQFIAKNYLTPEKSGLKGKILITFVIEKDGSINEIKVLQDIGYGTGDEAIRVMKKSLNWIPAQMDGKPVRVLFKFPITIQSAR
jgi:protein TonB